MRALVARLGLGPVLDLQSLDGLTEPDPDADARARLRGLLAVLSRARVSPSPPGAPRANPPTVSARGPCPGRRAAPSNGRVGATPSAPNSTSWSGDPPAPGCRAGTPRARALTLDKVTAGLPFTAWGVRRLGGGWIAPGALLMAHGALGLAYGLMRPRD